MTVTLSDLKTAVQARTDLPGFNDNALTGFINQAYLELYDLITNTFSGFNQTHFDFTMNSSDDGYAIPDSVHIYKLAGLDFNPGTSSAATVNAFQWAERTKFNWIQAIVTQPFLYQAPMVYCYLGDRIEFRPIGMSGGNFRCYYVPDLVLLVNDTDTVQSNLEKWHNFVIVGASIKLLDSAQMDSQTLQLELNKLEAGIKSFAQNRDQEAGKRVSDTRGFGFGYYPSTFTRFH